MIAHNSNEHMFLKVLTTLSSITSLDIKSVFINSLNKKSRPFYKSLSRNFSSSSHTVVYTFKVECKNRKPWSLFLFRLVVWMRSLYKYRLIIRVHTSFYSYCCRQSKGVFGGNLNEKKNLRDKMCAFDR